jgi:hypothetical protein
MLYRAIGLVLDFIHRLVCGRQKIPQRFGDWICLRPQVDGEDKPNQLDPLERASLNHWVQLSMCVLPHPPEDGDRSSLRNVVVFFVFHIQDHG